MQAHATHAVYSSQLHADLLSWFCTQSICCLAILLNSLRTFPEFSSSSVLPGYFVWQAAGRIEREGGNWVVAAPTGSGKTAVFI
jgi:hypothetical protein